MFGVSDAGLLIKNGNLLNGKKIITAKDGVDSISPVVKTIQADVGYAYTQTGSRTTGKVIEHYIDSGSQTPNSILINGSGYLVKCGIIYCGTGGATLLSVNVDGVDVCNSAKSTISLGLREALILLGEFHYSGFYDVSNASDYRVFQIYDDLTVAIRFENQLTIDYSLYNDGTSLQNVLLTKIILD